MPTDNNEQVYIKLSKSLDLIIDSAGKDLWPLMYNLTEQGEINKETSYDIKARLFLCLIATFFAGNLGPFHFEISRDDFAQQLLAYITRYLQRVATTYKIEDISILVKIYETMHESLHPALINCLKGSAKSREEGDKHLLILTIIFAGLLSSDRNRYGRGRPFDDLATATLFNIIKSLMEKSVNEFFPSQTAINDFFHSSISELESQAGVKKSGCLALFVLLVIAVAIFDFIAKI